MVEIVFDDDGSFESESDVVIRANKETSFIQEEGIQQIQEQTELGQVLEHLNMDKIDPETRLSDIDMRTRLHDFQISTIASVDSLCAIGFFDIEALSITRVIKRLNVSLDGLGRKEIVDITGRQQDLTERSGMGGFIDKAKGFLGGGK